MLSTLAILTSGAPTPHTPNTPAGGTAPGPEHLRVTLEPRVTQYNCKHIDAIKAGTVKAEIPSQDLKKLRALPLLGETACTQLKTGICHDVPGYSFGGFPCSDWGDDFNSDGIPDCSVSDKAYITSCDGKPAPLGTTVDQGGVYYSCEDGGFLDAGYYYPKDTTVSASINYLANPNSGHVGGMKTIRENCPVSCQYYEKCSPATHG